MGRDDRSKNNGVDIDNLFPLVTSEGVSEYLYMTLWNHLQQRVEGRVESKSHAPYGCFAQVASVQVLVAQSVLVPRYVRCYKIYATKSCTLVRNAHKKALDRTELTRLILEEQKAVQVDQPAMQQAEAPHMQ